MWRSIIGPAVDDPSSGEADYGIKALAQDTGGRAFFPSKPVELKGIYDGIAEELGHQYALGYVPTDARRDGAWRRVAVQVLAGDARPRTRAGYFAPHLTGAPARTPLRSIRRRGRANGSLAEAAVGLCRGVVESSSATPTRSHRGPGSGRAARRRCGLGGGPDRCAPACDHSGVPHHLPWSHRSRSMVLAGSSATSSPTVRSTGRASGGRCVRAALDSI